MSRRQCELCGAVDQELVAGLTRLAEPIGGTTFGKAQRCRDRNGCRQRVEASGQPWEWVDGEIDAIGDPQHRGFTAAHLRVFAAARAWQPTGGTTAVAKPMAEVEPPEGHEPVPAPPELEDVFA